MQGGSTEQNAKRPYSIEHSKQEQILTLCAEFHYLLTLNGVLSTAFAVDFHNKRGQLGLLAYKKLSYRTGTARHRLYQILAYGDKPPLNGCGQSRDPFFLILP